MERLHKLAGVQDASTSSSPSQPPPEPDTQTKAPSQRPSRASLPLNRQASHKSFSSSKSRSRSRTNREGDGGVLDPDYPPPPPLDHTHHDNASRKETQHAPQLPPARLSHDTAPTTASASEDDTEDFAWGTSHPCFPHPNPHCLPSSPEYETTRVIRVRRDYLLSGDLYPQFANLYPEILDPLISENDFRFLITNINARLKAAFDPFSLRAWVDTVMGVLTGFWWDDFGWVGVKGGEAGLERFLEGWNEGCKREGRGVRVVGPRVTGFMSLDFVVPDPGIDGVGVGEEDEEGEGGLGPAE